MGFARAQPILRSFKLTPMVMSPHGRHSGRASPCEREPESSIRRWSFFTTEVQPPHCPSHKPGRPITRISRPVVTGFRLSLARARSAGMTPQKICTPLDEEWMRTTDPTYGFDSVIPTSVGAPGSAPPETEITLITFSNKKKRGLQGPLSFARSGGLPYFDGTAPFSRQEPQYPRPRASLPYSRSSSTIATQHLPCPTIP